MARPAVELAVALLGLAVLALALLWLFRFVQYRRAVRRSHARWLRYEHEAASGAGDRDRDRGLDWPSLKPFMLSPIPEERLDSGRVCISPAYYGSRVIRHNIWTNMVVVMIGIRDGLDPVGAEGPTERHLHRTLYVCAVPAWRGEDEANLLTLVAWM